MHLDVRREIGGQVTGGGPRPTGMGETRKRGRGERRERVLWGSFVEMVKGKWRRGGECCGDVWEFWLRLFKGKG